ncbi:polyprenyl synthetase family protein [Kibdelosporangium persicum]|uniref:Geranylgeranyl diphosphate synthase type I n=1 Tax=Kibdelosporangium persicum TaxID=2698649 RepID=A0ABX2F9V7_9PSEU|nr:polyprenyl synthetase family protein [Kibdelosporangium persicum]NRN68151.1 Geranylgeranyl diphosphate synthase type I [Kibdelosporangium persicum]
MHPTTIDESVRAHVELTLTEYLAAKQSTMASLTQELADALDALVEFILRGGKRIRPTFAWWGWRGAGGQPDAPAVLRAVSGLELIQACALVHDDLMDASAVRRGSPTVHVTFERLHRERGWLGPSDRFGMAAAILLGDIALAWADDMFYGSGVSATRIAAASEPWQAMRSEMLAGQYLDILTQVEGDESPEAALRVARMKTAAYTVERPLQMGATLAGADPEVIERLRAFGADIGVAFQLRDDLLGVFGDTEVTGKPAGDDLREGKRTLLVALGLRRATEAGAAVLRDCLGRQDLTGDDVNRARAVLVESGAVDAVEHRIEALTSTAMRALTSTDLAEPAGDRLAELAVAATRRNH